MPKQQIVKMLVVVNNLKALKALEYAAGVVGDIAEEMPWREDAQKAKRALLYAAKHLQVRTPKSAMQETLDEHLRESGE